MIDNVIANLKGKLEKATDPEEIREITSNIDELEKTKAEIANKDALIERQAREVKRLYLNDIAGNPMTGEPPVEPPQKPIVPKTLEQIIEEVTNQKGDKQ